MVTRTQQIQKKIDAQKQEYLEALKLLTENKKKLAKTIEQRNRHLVQQNRELEELQKRYTLANVFVSAIGEIIYENAILHHIKK